MTALLGTAPNSSSEISEVAERGIEAAGTRVNKSPAKIKNLWRRLDSVMRVSSMAYRCIVCCQVQPRITAVKLRLLCRDPLAPQAEILVESFPVDLGRGAEATVQIDDRWLSRRHCRLDVDGGFVSVRDMASRHGTYVNGQQVTESQLLPGDELCIGLTHFVAEYEPECVPADA
jgi:hypothetical protein